MRNNKGQFVKGSKPANKGTKGMMKSNKTSYQKGNVPPNTVPIGTISTRGKGAERYKYIKVANHKWVVLHHFIWQTYNGDIPKGYVLRFINGNAMDCNITNLVLISRDVNCRWNYNREKAGKSRAKHHKKKRLRKKWGLEILYNFK